MDVRRGILRARPKDVDDLVGRTDSIRVSNWPSPFNGRTYSILTVRAILARDRSKSFAAGSTSV